MWCGVRIAVTEYMTKSEDYIIAKGIMGKVTFLTKTFANGEKGMIELGLLLIASGLVIMGGGCFVCMAIITGALLYQHRKDRENGKD